MAETAADTTAVHELVITRLIPVPRHTLFRCWTEPALITQWFTPPPWKTIHAETDVRAGGSSLIIMQGPDGKSRNVSSISKLHASPMRIETDLANQDTASRSHPKPFA